MTALSDRIPDTPALLTPDWLTAALSAAGVLPTGGPRVASVAASPVGTGQMCDSLRLTLGYDGPTDGTNAPATLVAKLPAADPTSRETARTLGSYETEVRFYQELAGTLPMRTPAVYHADIEPETAAFVLLLEDLAPAAPGDQLAGCSLAEAEVAVDELVKLHAARWGDPGLASYPWLAKDRDASAQFMLVLLPSLWDGFRDRYAAEVGPEVHAAGDAVFAGLEGYLRADIEPWTILHGDYRLDNLLFDPRPGGTPIAVVDWQTCALGPGAQDLAYFVGAGLVPADRRTHESALVDRYHAALVAAGVDGDGYPRERLWRDYRWGTWAGLLMTVGAAMLVERTDRGDRMFLTMADRHARHALDLDAAEVLA
jgi:aminoglycoside/choline kinase family phosphotransferase